MGESTLEQYNELVGLIAWGTHPMLPRPEWGQDVAFLAFVFDGLHNTIDEFRNVLLAITSSDPIRHHVTFGQGSFGDECRYCRSTDYLGPLQHSPLCVWRRAREVLGVDEVPPEGVEPSTSPS